MEREMMALFPRRIHAILIDDPTRVRASSAKMLSLLNFKVVMYKSPSHALNRVLTGDNAHEIDVVFIDAKKALSCGFDFRRAVQAQLTIPDVYLLPRVDQVDRMRRALRRPGTYSIWKPLNVDDVCCLWRFIAWSKYCLMKKEKENEERQDQERIHLEQQQQLRQAVKQSILQALAMAPRNPGMIPDAAGPSNYLAAAGNTAGPSSLPVYPPPRPVFSAPVPAPAPLPPLVNPILVPAQAPRPKYHPYQHSRPPVPQGLFAPPRQAGGVPRRHGTTGPIMLNFEKPPQAGDRFTSMARASAAGHVRACSYAASSLHHSLNPGTVGHNEVSAMMTMHTGSKNNPPVAPPHYPQHVGVGSNEAAIPNLYNNNYHYNAGSVVAPQQAVHGVAPQHVGVGANEAAMPTLNNNNNSSYYYNTGSVVAPQPAGHGVAANGAAAAAMEALGNNNNYANYNAAPLVAPQNDVPVYDLAAFEEELNRDNFSNYSAGGSHMVPPEQVIAMASNLNKELTMAGSGAFSGVGVAAFSSSMVAQDHAAVAAPNDNQLAPAEALVGNGSLMGARQGLATAVDGNNAAGFEAMFPAEQDDENAFLLEDLLGRDYAPMSEAGAGLDSQMGGAAADAAESSLMGEERGMGIWDTGYDEDFEMVGDFVPNGAGDFMSRMA